MSCFTGEESFFVGWEDIAAVCGCDTFTVAKALILSTARPDATLCRMKHTGKPNDPNFTAFFGEHLYKWTRFAELKQIVEEYIRTHPATNLRKDSQINL